MGQYFVLMMQEEFQQCEFFIGQGDVGGIVCYFVVD